MGRADRSPRPSRGSGVFDVSQGRFDSARAVTMLACTDKGSNRQYVFASMVRIPPGLPSVYDRGFGRLRLGDLADPAAIDEAGRGSPIEAAATAIAKTKVDPVQLGTAGVGVAIDETGSDPTSQAKTAAWSFASKTVSGTAVIEAKFGGWRRGRVGR